jgi:hypothetical protein
MMLLLMLLNAVTVKCCLRLRYNRFNHAPPLPRVMTRLAAQLESSLSLQQAHEEEVSSWRAKHAALKKELDEVGSVIFSTLVCVYICSQTKNVLQALQSSASSSSAAAAAAAAAAAVTDTAAAAVGSPAGPDAVNQLKQQVNAWLCLGDDDALLRGNHAPVSRSKLFGSRWRMPTRAWSWSGGR